MPSLVTGIIGGIQGASAAHNAAAAQQTGYTNAATAVNGAVAAANPIVTNAASAAGAGATTAAQNAGTGATTAATNAGTGVASAAGTANSYLSPYMTSGTNASQSLSNLNGAGQFSFNPTDLQNTPGYQFALQQGNRGVTANAAAAGLLGSGGTGKALANYDSQLASSTYNQQYQNALQGYQANVQGYQANAGVLQGQVNTGLAASGTAGSNLTGAAQYAGNANINASQYSGTAATNAAQYAGSTNVAAANTTASNLVNAGVYTGNTDIGAGNATAQGDIGAANAWNGTLSSIGSAANTVAGLGFGAGGGWSLGNIGTNLGNLNGASNYSSNPYSTPPPIGQTGITTYSPVQFQDG